MTEVYPLTWIRDTWKPAGNWNVRHSRGLNWCYLSDCRYLYKVLVYHVLNGNEEQSRIVARSLGHWALTYLRGRW